MNKTVVALVGLALLVSPAIPSLADGHDDLSSEECPDAFHGDHWSLIVDADLPGASEVAIVDGNATLAEAIRLPGDELHCKDDSDEEDRVRLFTGQGMLRVEDREELRMGIVTEENASASFEIADDVSVENRSEEDEARYRLTPADGPTLVLTGENITREDRTFAIGGEARTFRAEQPVQTQPQPDDGNESAEDNRSDAREEERQRTEEGEEGRQEAREDRDRRDQRRITSQGSYAFGAASLRLDNDTLRNVQWRNVTLFQTIEVPGLTPAEERQRGPQLQLRGEDARVRVAAAGGMMARIDAGDGVQGTLSSDVEVREEDEGAVFLSTDELLVVLEGEDLEIRGPTVTASELRFHAHAPQPNEGPVWHEDRPAEAALELPQTLEGRHVSFQFHQGGLRNLSVHGTPIGEVSFDPVTVEEAKRQGAHYEAEGESFELRVQDVPAVQLRLEARNLSVDLADNTTLPSGAIVESRVEGDELRISVKRPADALSNRTSVEHRPADEPVERTEGPAPGLQTRTERGQLGVRSTSPSTISTHFDSERDGIEANVSLELGLARAMLIDDTNGNSRVDVGEPALAERPLTNGTVAVEGDELVHRFPLWSGNLTVTVEPGNETAKVTYVATNLSAPPGTLFVLETRLEAPPDANLTPTDTGVVVDNGTMQAEYSAAGPVTVDGEDAWAQRSIFVDGDDRVRVLMAYPAGDDITHDPTVSVQSSTAEVVQRLAASPYAILAGATLAGLLVAGTVLHRRRRQP